MGSMKAGNAGQFVNCGKTFGNAVDQSNHTRDHQRSMLKRKDPVTGVRPFSCFLGHCATSPSRPKNNRDGPEFASETEQLIHIWQDHGCFTLKTVDVTYRSYCNKWLTEPYEWMSHASSHRHDALKIITEVGYAGVQTGRDILPRICSFCYHDEQLPDHVRLNVYTREGHPKHINRHLKNLKGSVTECPCYPEMCKKSAKMYEVQLQEHMHHA